MSKTWIKICGLRDAKMAGAAAEVGANAVGLVFVEASPRFVTVDQAKGIVASLPMSVERIGLFVDAPPEVIRKTAEVVGLRTVQLHGREDVAYARSLAPLRVLKALPFGEDLPARIAAWRDCPNLVALLIDAPLPADGQPGDLPGGTGRAVDWAKLRRLLDTMPADQRPRVVLAGGLNPSNVAEAIRAVRPFGVDVSSGVESRRGQKDASLIRAFVAAAREAEAALSAG